MTDRYAHIREALAMGPTLGPWEPNDKRPVGGHVGDSDGKTPCEANATYIVSLDPATVRELLAERDQLAAALEAAREDACVSIVADIRLACGDNGKRMQSELVEYIRELAEDAERWRALREMDGWQPMETAPKDGTRVLLWFEWHDLPVVGDFRHGRWWCVHSVGGNLVYNNGGVLAPTHWRPLPAPPAIYQARGKGVQS